MKKILLLTVFSSFILSGCYSSRVNMSMGNMRLISSSAAPQDVMNFATEVCKDDFYQGAASYPKREKSIALSA